MQVLILGGTQFLGRHLTQASLDAGHDVTLFNRGVTNKALFADSCERVFGDRDGGLQALAGRAFDVCIDPSGYVPRLVGDSCRLLRDVIGHYTFISSISVYPKFVSGQDESAPLAVLEDATTEVVDDSTYGGLKVLCEDMAEQVLPGRVLQVRAGLLVGPYDPTDRFTYWPVRTSAGGRCVAPVSEDLPVQFIDARDVAEWIVKCAEIGVTGIFNVTGEQTTLGRTLDACRSVTGNATQPIWLEEEFLLEHDVTPWVDLPMWLPERARGMMQVSITKASAHGLELRAPTTTIRDLLEWHHCDRDSLVVGLSAARERELLALAGRR